MFRNLWKFIDDGLYVGGLVLVGTLAFITVALLGLGLVRFLACLTEVK